MKNQAKRQVGASCSELTRDMLSLGIWWVGWQFKQRAFPRLGQSCITRAMIPLSANGCISLELCTKYHFIHREYNYVHLAKPYLHFIFCQSSATVTEKAICKEHGSNNLHYVKVQINHVWSGLGTHSNSLLAVRAKKY